MLTRIHTGYEGNSIHLGGYTITPGLDESLGFESNVLGTTTDQRSSPIILTSPSVSIDRPYSDGDVNASASLQNNSVLSLSQESYTNDTITLGASHSFGNDTGTIGYAHIDSSIVPTELNFLNVLNPIPIAEDVVRLNYATQFSRFSVTPNASFTSTRIGNSIQDGQLDNLSYLDRDDFDAGVNVGYELATNRTILFVAEGDDTVFPQRDPFQPNLDDHNIAFLVGYQDNSGGLFNYFLLAGYELEQFNYAGYGSQSQPIAEGGVVYTPTALTTISLVGRHEIEQTTQPNQIGFTYDHVGLELDRELRRNLILSGNFNYDRDSLEKSNVSGNAVSLSSNLAWRINHQLTMNFTVSYSTFSSSTPITFTPAQALQGIDLLTNNEVTNNTGSITNFSATVGVHIGL